MHQRHFLAVLWIAAKTLRWGRADKCVCVCVTKSVTFSGSRFMWGRVRAKPILHTGTSTRTTARFWRNTDKKYKENNPNLTYCFALSLHPHTCGLGINKLLSKLNCSRLCLLYARAYCRLVSDRWNHAIYSWVQRKNVAPTHGPGATIRCVQILRPWFVCAFKPHILLLEDERTIDIFET